MSTAQQLRRALVLALIAVIGYAAWQRTQPPANTFAANGEHALEKRFDAYVTLRLLGRWNEILEMVAPDQRSQRGLAALLEEHGSEVTRTLGITLLETSLDAAARTARMRVAVESELQVSKLPAEFRGGLSCDDPRELQGSTVSQIDWVWIDGTWYLHLGGPENARGDPPPPASPRK